MAQENTHELELLMKEKIDNMTVFLYEQQQKYTIQLIRDKIPLTKEQLTEQKMLKTQYSMLTSLYNNLKKSKKVGDMSIGDFESKLKEIMKEESSMTSIVKDLNIHHN